MRYKIVYNIYAKAIENIMHIETDLAAETHFSLLHGDGRKVASALSSNEKFGLVTRLCSNMTDNVVSCGNKICASHACRVTQCTACVTVQLCIFVCAGLLKIHIPP